MLSQVSSKQDLSLRIMGIDPGTENLGMSLGVCDFRVPSYNIIEGHTFNVKSLIHKSNEYLVNYQSRNIAMYRSVYELTYQLMHDYQPDLVICESPYMDKRFPQSYMLLSLCVQSVQQAVKDYSIFIHFETIDPASAKKGVGAKGNSGDKDQMREAVLNNSHIKSNLNLNDFDEHTIDSIAIGFNGYLGILTK